MCFLKPHQYCFIINNIPLVAANQYGAITEMLLALYSSSDLSTEKRDLANYYALQVCGLAFTNDDIAARVNAFGPLAFCACNFSIL